MTDNTKVVSKGHSLYLCYFGLLEPLVQTQVLPYLRQICSVGFRVTLLTFETNPEEKWNKNSIKIQKEKFLAEGIDWHFLKYHKRPTLPATVFDILNGAFFTWKTIRKKKVDILHGKVHVPTFMGALGRKLSFSNNKPKLLFDIRGFFPEEYTDAGWWKENGLLFKVSKRVEKWLLKESDGFVVLTEKAREILFPESKDSGFDKFNRPVEVIPCCVDFKRFDSVDEATRSEYREKLGISNRFVITYVGSLGGWYLNKEMVDFMSTAKQKNENVFALILTQSDPKEIRALLESGGFEKTDFLITKVLPEEIPFYLSSADAALSFIKPCYSKQASSPTKNAEYFAMGLPTVVNEGIGDTAEMTVEDRTGAVIEDFSVQSYRKSFGQIEKMLENRRETAQLCKSSAVKRFDLEKVGGERYRKIYRKLLAK